jgi:hypothetical protein
LKKIAALIILVLLCVLSVNISAEQSDLLDITIKNNECTELNEGSTYDQETRTLTLAPGKYGNIFCDNDLTVKNKNGTVQIFQIKAEKVHGSAVLKIVNANIKTDPDHIGSTIICNGVIEITNSNVEVDYFIGTDSGKIDISKSNVNIEGIDKMQGYIFASGKISIKDSNVTADYNINTYNSMVIENSTVKLPSKYSHGGYITSPLGILIKNSNLDIFYYISCDGGDFRAVNSNIKISLNREDNKRRSNIEVGDGNIIITNCNILVDAYIKSNLGNITITNCAIDTGSVVTWTGTVKLDNVEGSINGAKSINSESSTGIFGKKIVLKDTKLPEAHHVGTVTIGQDPYATVVLNSGDMAYGFKLKSNSSFPVIWIEIIAAVVIIAIAAMVFIVVRKKRKKAE